MMSPQVGHLKPLSLFCHWHPKPRLAPPLLFSFSARCVGVGQWINQALLWDYLILIGWNVGRWVITPRKAFHIRHMHMCEHFALQVNSRCQERAKVYINHRPIDLCTLYKAKKPLWWFGPVIFCPSSMTRRNNMVAYVEITTWAWRQIGDLCILLSVRQPQ